MVTTVVHLDHRLQEGLESILGKAYFAFMCARWAVLFFWEALFPESGERSPKLQRAALV